MATTYSPILSEYTLTANTEPLYVTNSTYILNDITYDFGIDLGTKASNYTQWGAPITIANEYWNTTVSPITITNEFDYDTNLTGTLIISNDYLWTPPTPKEAKRQAIRSRLCIAIKSRADIIPINIPNHERMAMETLREMITENEFRRYLKNGFILVRGKSGDVYQVFRSRSHTKIWRKGKVIEEVCTRIKDPNIPPTDNVIAFKTIIETDEQEFKSIGNVYRMAA